MRTILLTSALVFLSAVGLAAAGDATPSAGAAIRVSGSLGADGSCSDGLPPSCKVCLSQTNCASSCAGGKVCTQPKDGHGRIASCSFKSDCKPSDPGFYLSRRIW